MLVKFWFIDLVIFKMGMISLLMLGNIYIYIFIQIIEFGEVFRRFLTRKLPIRIRWDFLPCVSFRLVSTCYAFWVKYKTLHNCSELRFFRAEFLFSGDGPTWFGLGFFVAMAGW